MTLHEALHIAQDIIAAQPSSERLDDVIQSLSNLEKYLLRDFWTKDDCLRAFRNWELCTGRPPTVKDLSSVSLPSRAVIRRLFGKAPGEVLQNLYPEGKYRVYCDKSFRTLTKEELIAFFRDQFEKLKPVSGKDYNNRRIPGSPIWETAARRMGHCSWKQFWTDVTGEAYAPSAANYGNEIKKVVVTSPLTESLNKFLQSEEEV